MANMLLKVCEDVLKIKDEEVEEMREVIRGQKEYFHPLKYATAQWQHDLGEHNEKVLNKVLELKALIESGANLEKKGAR